MTAVAASLLCGLFGIASFAILGVRSRWQEWMLEQLLAMEEGPPPYHVIANAEFWREKVLALGSPSEGSQDLDLLTYRSAPPTARPKRASRMHRWRHRWFPWTLRGRLSLEHEQVFYHCDQCGRKSSLGLWTRDALEGSVSSSTSRHMQVLAARMAQQNALLRMDVEADRFAGALEKLMRKAPSEEDPS